MNIDNLPWGDRTVGGVLKSHFSLTRAKFEFEGEKFIALEWYRRVGSLFNAYASYIVITAECDKTADDELMKKIAFGKGGLGSEKYIKVEFSETLNRNVLLCSNPDRKTELDQYLQELKASCQS